MPSEWLTYIAAGERLGISAEAVRQKAIRNRWPRRPGNDGRAQVQVDVDEVIASAIPRQPPVDRPADAGPTPEQPPVDHAADARTLDALDGHIGTLKDLVARLEVDLGVERARTDTERVRADGERDRADAERARADALAAELRSQTAGTAEFERQLASLKAVVDGLKVPPARPWWRRLAG